MRASFAEKPSVTLFRSVEAEGLFAHLDSLRANPSIQYRPTVTSVLAILVARVLASDPVMNSHFENDEIRRFREVHLAVAVATDDGLVAPVLRPEYLHDEESAAQQLSNLAELSRGKGLKLEHLVPFTFTLTNLGSFGVEYFTPIINPPNIGILGVGRSPIDGGTRLPLSLSFDHAAIDGADGAKFLQSLSDEIARMSTI
jgi:pyruvate dehydrogenase E2 component (dihydrolipoamide acetyltransferase)